MPKRVASWKKLWSQWFVPRRLPLRLPRLEVEFLEMRTLPSVLFTDPMVYPTGSGPVAMVTGDFNGDGNLDLATANRNQDSVSILLGSGQGGFSSSATYSSGSGSQALATADFNGDGKADLAVANFSSSAVSILMGNGNGTFASPNAITIPSDPTALVAGDFNGDGKADLAVANGSNVSIFLGNGNGTFGPATNFSVGSTANYLATGDFLGNGKIDLAVTTSSDLAILLGNGNGTFGSPTNLLPGSSPSYVAVADFNGDQKADLAVVVNNVATNNVDVLLSNGNGTFGNPTTVVTGGATAATVATGDFNGDGKIDLATTNGSSATTSLALTVGISFGNGMGGFSANPTIYVAGGDPIFAVTGDFSGDGKLDLAVSNGTPANYVTLLQGNGLGGFLSPTNFAAGTDPYAATTGDFNGDNRTDIAIANYAGDAATVLLNNGSAGFTTLPSDPAGDSNATPIALAAGKFTGNSNQDLAIANFDGGNSASPLFSILLGNGNGTFSNFTTGTAGNAQSSIAIGAFNNATPGILDLAITNFNDNTVSILLGNGNGTFSGPTNYPVEADPTAVANPTSIAVGDFNGDGKLDLAIVDEDLNSTSNATAGVSVLFGNGNGTFGPPAFIQLGSLTGFPDFVAVGNFITGGLPDLAVSVLGDDEMVILPNNGNGTFPAAGTTFSTGPGPASIAVADFNGDGKLDLAVANSTIEAAIIGLNAPYANISDASVFLGNGNGTFGLPLNYLAGNNPESVTAGDFNGDGKPDLAVVNEGDNDVTVLTNQILASRLTVKAGPSQAAGTPFNITVIATDQFGSTAPGYLGTVHFSKTDTAFGSALPADYTFTAADQGLHVFTGTATLITTGNQTLTVTDTQASGISGSRIVTVNAGAAKTLAVTASPTTITAGNSTSLTVTVVDQYGNRAANYTGTVHFTKTDAGAASAVPPDYAFVAADNGQHIFTNGATLVTAATQTVTAADTLTNTITGNVAVTVSVGSLAHFAVTPSVPSVTAGTTFSLTVKAQDGFGNTVTNYTGKVHFTKSDTNVSSVVPADYTFVTGDNGQHVFSGVALVTAPSQTVTAMDSATNSISGFATVSVNAAGAMHYLVALPPTPVIAGNLLTVTVTAQDTYGNTATTYTGKVHFTRSDTNASALVPPDYTFVASDNGQHIFTGGVTLVTAGPQTVTATDASTNTINGLATVTVNPAAAKNYTVTLPTGPVVAGSLLTVTVAALDPYGNMATTYTGKVHFTKSDTNASALVPPDYTFVASDNGQHIFTSGVTLVTAGLQTVTATDASTNSISGLATVTVNPASAKNYTVTLSQSPVTAGSTVSVTVKALDPYGNTATGYTGKVHFTKSDTNVNALVPVDYTFVTSDNGQHVFTNGVTLATAGPQTVTATDSSSNSISGLATVTVNPAGVTHYAVTLSPPVTAGTPVTVTVTALDPYGNTVTGYTGKAHFTKSDTNTNAAVPADYTFVASDNGQHIFTNGVTFATAGPQTVTATDTSSSGISGLATVTVNPAGATHYTVTLSPPPVTAGTPLTVTVTALDTYGNIATGYTGKAHFLKSDTNSNAVVPADYTFVASDNGQHIFTNGVTFATAGSQTVTATDSSSSSISGLATVTVSPAGATHYTVTLSPPVTAGTAVNITVTALDPYGNTATGYTGKAHFLKSDTNTNAVVPADYTFVASDNGQHIFTNGVAFATTGPQTVTATDTSSSGISGMAAVTVNPAGATHYSVTLSPPTVTAGTALTVTVTALDTYGNATPGYTGKVHFTKSDTNANAVVPADYTFVASDNGQHIFTNGVTLATAGLQTVTATDTSSSGISGMATVSVNPAGASHYTVAFQTTPVTAGTAVTITVTALDTYGNTATGYTGKVHFTKSDTNVASAVPADYTFVAGDGGQHVFTSSVTLITAGSQTVTATDAGTGTINGLATVTVNAAAVKNYTVTLSPATVTAGTALNVTVTAIDQFGNTATGYTGKVHFTKSDSNSSALVPADYTFVAGDTGQHIFTGGVTLATVGTQTVTATDAATNGISGSATATVNPGNAKSYTVTFSTSSVLAGSAFSATVKAIDQFGNTATGYTGTVHFTKSDTNANSSVPADYTFVAGDSGQHIFTGGVTLATAGTQTVTATDKQTISISGNATITVTPIIVSRYSVMLSAPTVIAGNSLAITVTALDQFGNTATGYLGTVHFTKSDTGLAAALPADYTFVAADNGQHVFAPGATLVTAGNQTVTATDATTKSINGNAVATVNPAAAKSYLVTLSAPTVIAGNALGVTVTALDQFGNQATTYTGTVHFTKSDAGSTSALPPDYQFVAGDTGQHVFAAGATLVTVGSQTVTATDASATSITGNAAVTVTSAAAKSFAVTPAAAPATAGTAFGVTVTALDQFGNRATTYIGTVHFTKSDTAGASAVPGDYSFVAGDTGQHVFAAGVTLVTAGSQTVTATDTANNSISGSATITVNGSAANHYSVTTTAATVTAGVPFSVTVTALDQFGNRATGYLGTVHFTKSDTASGSSVPADYTFVAGDNAMHVFANGAVLAKPGSQTVTATDSAAISIAGNVKVTVNAGSANHYTITSSPAVVTAGLPFTITVIAVDLVGNTATGYTGTVHFTTSDTSASTMLPADYTFVSGDNGQHVFSAGVTLITAGNQTVTGKDTQSSSLTGTATVTVNAASASHLSVVAQSGVAAGIPFNVTVTALDQFGNTAKGFADTVHFKSTDTSASLPPDSSLTAGVGTFSATLQTLGTQHVTATDTSSSSITGTTGPISVGTGAANHFAVSAPAVATLGTPFNFTVTMQDNLYNTVPGYTGTVHFISSDRSATLPADVTLTNGTGIFSATLRTAGNQTITVYDAANNTLTGRSAPIAVSTTATHFVVNVPSGTQAGSVFVFTVTALDQFNVVASSYTGIVRLSSSDGQAALAANGTLTGGIGFFAGALRTAGSQTITATDTASAGMTGTSAGISVTALAANHFAVSVAASAITGSPTPVTVMAEDQFGNAAQTYNGTVHFSSTDGSAQLPADSTLSAGLGAFSATFNSTGSQTLSATDSASITGTSNAVFVLGLVVTNLTPTPTGFVATFSKPFDPTQINLYDSLGAFGPADVTLTGPGAPQTSFHGSLIIDPTDTTITFIKTSTFTSPVSSFNPSTGVLAAGTYTVTFRSATNGFKDLQGSLLDGNADGIPGDNFTTTFVVSATPAVVVGVPGFARGPNSSQNVNLPNNLGLGIPISLSNANNVTSGSFTLQYNSALLVVSGVAVNAALPGATLTLASSSTPGNAVINFTSPTALTSGPLRLGSLTATVPNSAAAVYKAKAILHFSSAQLNGGAITATPDDAVEVAAYLGDATGEGPLSGGDTSLISRVATGLDDNPALGIMGGFSVFQLVDPILIGDVATSGSVSATSVTLINSFLSGTPRPQLPPVPPNLSLNITGPDPDLSLPTDIVAAAGSTVIVPVEIDTGRPAGSTGMTEAVLALSYNPLVFSVSTADVELGSLPSAGTGWQLQSAVNAQTGEIGIDIFSSTPIQTTAAGSLVTIALHVRATAPAGATGLSIETQVNPTGQRVYQTTVADAEGTLVLHPAVTALGTMPGAPGEVTVTGAPFVVEQFIAPPQNVVMEQGPAGGQPQGNFAAESAGRAGSLPSDRADSRAANDGFFASSALAITDSTESRGQQAIPPADDRSTFTDLESGDQTMGAAPPPEALWGGWLPGANLPEWSTENIEREIVERLFAKSDLDWLATAR